SYCCLSFFVLPSLSFFLFFNDTPPPEIYTLSYTTLFRSHVHQFGDCSATDASSAGAHFNPTNQPHAGPDAAARHEGDMGNVEADASGNAKLDYVDHQISLANDAKSAIGRSVVVHAKPDDLKTQPSGDSGARIACGVIGWAKTSCHT